MKFFLSAILFSSIVFAQEERVVRQLTQYKWDREITVSETTFVPNIHGYGCPWPGIRVPEVFSGTSLRHGSHSFDENVLAFKKGDLEFRFCDFSTAQEVFGEAYIVGVKKKIEVHLKLELVEIAGKHLVLRETVSTNFLNAELESVAQVGIGNKEDINE